MNATQGEAVVSGGQRGQPCPEAVLALAIWVGSADAAGRGAERGGDFTTPPDDNAEMGGAARRTALTASLLERRPGTD